MGWLVMRHERKKDNEQKEKERGEKKYLDWTMTHVNNDGHLERRKR